VRPGRAADTPGVDWSLELLGLEALADHKPGDLSLGHQKLLGVARTLAARPKVVLLDEPAAGLDSSESVAFGSTLEDIAATGIGVLLIDHDMSLVLGVCDYVYVFEFGVVIAEGSAAQIRANPKVVEAYLGEQVDASHAPRRRVDEPRMLMSVASTSRGCS
jgi:branched-chain amino acid transport system ATP-binding protein